MIEEPPSAELIMAVRRATGMAVLQAREFARTTDPVLLRRIVAESPPCPEKLPFLPEELRERIFKAAASQNGEPYFVDPIESDPILAPLIRKAMDEMEAKSKAENGEAEKSWLQGGNCHLIWRRTKQHLFEEHGIEWYSPAEMNPCTIFD